MTSSTPATQLPTRRLGDSSLVVSAVGLGCNNFGRRLDLEASAAVLEAALAAGITFFDTADIYGGGGASEALIAGERGLVRFETLQNEYSLLERGIEADVAPVCERLGVSILPYFPLASGLLTGKYRRGEVAPEGTRLAGSTPGSEEQFRAVEALRGYAEERGIEMVDVAIGGLAAQPAVASVIAGATKPEQVRANVGALRWEPTEADLRELDLIAVRR